MRIYTKEGLEKELVKAGFKKTRTSTEKHDLWKYANGKVVSIPNDLDIYPDYILDKILISIGKLYSTDNNKIISLKYEASGK
ncbi:hypothetical protein ACFL0U_03865 [Pseudomonadota bacterium]